MGRSGAHSPAGGIRKMIGQTVSHYRVLGELGRGGMGVIYRAEDTRLDRRVALKFLPPEYSHHPEAVERFRQILDWRYGQDACYMLTDQALAMFDEREENQAA